MDLNRLKSETAREHEQVEGLLGVMSSTLDRVIYVGILQKLSGFISGWEAWAETVSVPSLRAHLDVRKRSALLAADLEFLSSPLPEAFYPGPSLSADDPFDVLGAMYVIEGSTLGGQYIARHVVEVLSLEPDQGDSYFRGYGDRTGAMWREIKVLLEEVSDEDADSVIFAAKRMFEDFREWIRPSDVIARRGTMNV